MSEQGYELVQAMYDDDLSPLSGSNYAAALSEGLIDPEQVALPKKAILIDFSAK